MEKRKIYEKIKEELSSTSCLVEQLVNIDYGVQFYIFSPNIKNTVRIFESKKKGIRVDLSQVKDIDLKKKIEQINFNNLIESSNNNVADVSKISLEGDFVKLVEKLKINSERLSIDIIDVKKINSGVQVRLSLPNGTIEYIRIYKSGKRGIFLDSSLLKNFENYDLLHQLYECSYSDFLNATSIVPRNKKKIPKSNQRRSKKDIKNNKKSKKEQNKSSRKSEIEYSKSQRPSLEKIALDIINFVKNKGISVMRYDSKISESIYLKFDYGMAGSLRISAHDSKKTNLKYTFNIIKGLEKPYIKAEKTSSGEPCNMYFYPFELACNVAYDIFSYKRYRISKYGDLKYEKYMLQHKSSVGVRRGFWSKAKEV